MITAKQIRNNFLDFFKKNGHEVVPSSPLIPHNDPTLLFTNSGMVQFKDVFTGEQKVPYKRATTVQKCLRAGGKHNDLENVGYTARHHTFFEMLGNFSFADYFKEEAIYYAYNLIVKELGIPQEKLYVTVYHEDEDALNLWKKIGGFSEDKIIKIATSDNFWAMGDTGPCGPCSEIFYDHGAHIPGGLPGTPEEDGDRFIEIWNLVFMQFEQKADGSRIPLPKPCIDTGMGLERVVGVMQGTHDNFKTDLFVPIIDEVAHLSGVKAEGSFSHRVIADHLRASAFMITDGILPSNEGRGYVLRRIMRRAMRHVHLLGYKKAMMHQLIPVLIQQMGDAYPELERSKSILTMVLEQEEERFQQTLDKGMKILNEALENNVKNGTLEGEVAFKLYDTYGFPLDLTASILRDQNIGVDHEGFDKAMDRQKEEARRNWAGSGEEKDGEIWYELQNKLGPTEFTGYSTTSDKSKVIALIDPKSGESVENSSEDEVYLLSQKTCFYAESGGQIGDTGNIVLPNGAKLEVLDTKKKLGSLYVHRVKLNGNTIKVGDLIYLEVNSERRKAIKRAHTATHMLQAILINVLGDHVVQRGSLVAPDRLRFDFSHFKAMTKEEIEKVSLLLNIGIQSNMEVGAEIKSHTQAIADGATALFGEKYGSEVRVISIKGEANNNFSMELCGGTHMERTGGIGLFIIQSEGSVASGVRRIEALTGVAALEFIQKERDIIFSLSNKLKCKKEDIESKVEEVIVNSKKSKSSSNNTASSTENLVFNNIKVVLADVKETDMNVLRMVADKLRSQNPEALTVVSGVVNEKASVGIAVGTDLVNKVNAVPIAKSIAELLGGGGGGKPEYAQAGGSNLDKQLELKSYIEKIMIEKVGFIN